MASIQTNTPTHTSQRGRFIKRFVLVCIALLLIEALAGSNLSASQQSSVDFTRQAVIGESLASYAPDRTLEDSKPIVLGYYSNWPSTSRDSLERFASHLTHVTPEWMSLSSDGTSFVDLRTLTDRETIEPFMRAQGLSIIAMLNNHMADANDPSKDGMWNTAAVSRLVANKASRSRFIADLKAYLITQRWQGVNVRFVQVDPRDRSRLTALVREMRDAFKPVGLLVTVSMAVQDSAYDLVGLAAASDFIVPGIYNQQSPSNGQGVTSMSWTRSVLAALFARVPADKVVLGFSNYAADHTDDNAQVMAITYQQALTRASETNGHNPQEGQIALDPRSFTPIFHYTDAFDNQHSVHILDATTLYNQWTIARYYRPRGAALWRLGAEDPSVWKVIGRDVIAHSAGDRKTVASLRQISYGPQPWVTFEGTGSLLYLAGTPADGTRMVTFDQSTGLSVFHHYDRLPSGYVVRRNDSQPKKIVLTFDDGPDPTYTPQILDILERERVPATFFVVGQAAQNNPDLLRRISARGYEIGNHTYTHPRLGELTNERARLEIAATQRVIQAIIGRSTRLFRLPYPIDVEPHTRDQLDAMRIPSDWNFIIVGEDIDPRDRSLGSVEPNDATLDRSAADIAARAWAQRNKGNIILLDDGGGDHSATVAALPLIIRQFRDAGYEFTTVAGLGNLTSDQVMPPIAPQEQMTVDVARVVLVSAGTIQSLLVALFGLSIVFGVSRQIMVAILALIQRRRDTMRVQQFDPAYQPLVSVVIAAYNEEKVINRTIHTILSSNYPHIEVVIVDDGSKDRTSAVVDEAFGGDDRVVCLRKVNGGKAVALNRGILQAHGDIIVALDADTLFTPDTIARLVRHFVDPNVGAVAGNIRVGNTTNLLTRWQSLEYITSQNFDRRAYDLLNCITVVPGAVGAWRRAAIEQVGGFTHETLAEDADLTWRLNLAGYGIRNENTALAFTEAPESLKNLAKQRFRWAFGTLQCLWKHRRSLFHKGAFGWFAMPNLWLNQVLFSAIAPIMDIMIVFTIITGNFVQVVPYYLLMMAVEVLAAVLAMWLDGANEWRLLPWMVLQRFLFRQLMYYVILKSIWAAFAGTAVGWNKFERTGTAQVAQS